MNIEEHTRSLRETRMRLWEEAKRHLDDCRAAHPGREMSGEEREKWDRLNERIDAIDVEVAELSGAEQREREAAITREAMEREFGTSGAQRFRTEEDRQVRTFLNPEESPGVRSLKIPLEGIVREKELIRQGAGANEVRALAWDTGSIASGVPTLMARKLYEYMEDSVAMMRAPTTKIISDSGADMAFPKLAAHGIATQVSGHGTAIAGTDATFDKTTIGAYKYGELYRIASEVISDASFDVIDFVSRNVGRAVGRVVDTALVTGTGSGEPNGLMVALAGGGAGSVTTGGSLLDPSYEKLVDLVYGPADEYLAGGNAGWLMRRTTAAVIRKLRDGEGGTVGAPLWVPSLTQGIQGGEPDRLLGYAAYTDPNVASLASNARVMSFGDFSAYYIRIVGGLVVERDDSRYFDTDEVAVRGKIRVDGDLLDSEALQTMVRNV